MTTLILPVPPSANVYWRHTVDRRTGRPLVYLSEVAQVYREVVEQLARHRGITPAPLGTELVLTVDWFRAPNPVTKLFQGDTGNIEKQLGDALRGVAYVDDDTTAEIHLRRWDTEPERPRVVVTIEVRAAADAPVDGGFITANEQFAFEQGLARLASVRAREREAAKARAKKRKSKSKLNPNLQPKLAVYR